MAGELVACERRGVGSLDVSERAVDNDLEEAAVSDYG
jgi:hypothetical protein